MPAEHLPLPTPTALRPAVLRDADAMVLAESCPTCGAEPRRGCLWQRRGKKGPVQYRDPSSHHAARYRKAARRAGLPPLEQVS